MGRKELQANIDNQINYRTGEIRILEEYLKLDNLTDSQIGEINEAIIEHKSAIKTLSKII